MIANFHGLSATIEQSAALATDKYKCTAQYICTTWYDFHLPHYHEGAGITQKGTVLSFIFTK